jgi:hypothetical protein
MSRSRGRRTRITAAQSFRNHRVETGAGERERSRSRRLRHPRLLRRRLGLAGSCGDTGSRSWLTVQHLSV